MRPGEPFSPKGLFTGVWVPTWLAKTRKMPAAAKLVYGRASSLDTGTGIVEFRIDWMAAEVGVDEKTVRSAVSVLEERGFWRVERPAGVDRLTHRPFRYAFLWHEAISAASIRRNVMVDGPGETPAPKREDRPPPSGNNARSYKDVGEEGLGELSPPTPPRGGPEWPVKVDRRAVSDAERQLTDAILAEFNEQAGTGYSGAAEHRRAIVGRIRERPAFDLAAHGRLIRVALADPWWKGAPGPQVIYGNAGIFEQAVERAKAAKGSTLSADEVDRLRGERRKAEAAEHAKLTEAWWENERQRETAAS